MAGKITIAVFIVVLSLLNQYTKADPAIATAYNPFELCIENCAQCKKMLGAWFEGPLCVESCIKFKGKLIPECEDFGSIAPFLNKL